MLDSLERNQGKLVSMNIIEASTFLVRSVVEGLADHHCTEKRMGSSSSDSSEGSKSPSPLRQLLSNSKRDQSPQHGEGGGGRGGGGGGVGRMLVTVSWMSSIWEVRVVVSGQERVKGLIQAALAAFAKEDHSLPCGPDPDHYRLFSSPFSLQSLDANACLKDVGVRSFILRNNIEMEEVVI